jgi:histidinol dehydrogenase
MIRILDIGESEVLLARRRLRLRRAEKIVAPILEAVRRRGDAALYRCARRWDGLGGRNLVVEPR